MKIAFIGGTVIDGTGASPKPGSSVIIDDSKIIEINQNRDFGPDVQVYDVSGKTIMPGLIDCHQHMSVENQVPISFQQGSFMYIQSKTIMAMKADLETGFTTVRDLGGLEAGFVKAQKEGIMPGPRLQTCVNQIQATNGILDYMPGIGGAISPQGYTASIPGVPSVWADGVDECRKKTREMLRYGAQVIKILNSAHPMARPWLDPWRSTYTIKEMKAIVEEAHNAGVTVTAHGIGRESTKQAVLAGVDCIEHGINMDEETMEEMIKRGTWWVPTLLIWLFHSTINPDLPWREFIKPIYEAHKSLLPKAIEKGIKIAGGSDLIPLWLNCSEELELMVESGVSSMQAIEISTMRAAQCMGMDDMVGTIERGKEADLLVIDGDPLADIKILQDLNKLLLVMQAGKPVAGPMEKEFPWVCTYSPQMKED